MRTKWFVPGEGLKIRDHQTMELVPAEGQEVRAGDPYYIRRVNDASGTLLASCPASAKKKGR